MADYQKFENEDSENRQPPQVSTPEISYNEPAATPPQYVNVTQPYVTGQGYGQQLGLTQYPIQPGNLPQAPGQQTITHVTATVAPSDYYDLALFVTICCCLPLGLMALTKSKEVKNRMAIGDFTGAQEASIEARFLAMTGLRLGITFAVLVAIILVVYFCVI